MDAEVRKFGGGGMKSNVRRLKIEPKILALSEMVAAHMGISLDTWVSQALHRDMSRLQGMAAELPLATLFSKEMIGRMMQVAAATEEEKKQEEAKDTDRDEAEDPNAFRERLRREAAGEPNDAEAPEEPTP